MREGELCALRWENVNLNEGYINVKESVKRVAVFDKNGKKEMKTLILDPKTQNSIRTIPLPQKLIDKLKELNQNTTYVFSDNEPVSHKSLYFQWQKVIKSDNRINYHKFHALRHTYATLLLSKGADLKSVQDLMGHYDMRITQVYLHSLSDVKRTVVNLLD